jgi:urease accessory protein
MNTNKSDKFYDLIEEILKFIRNEENISFGISEMAANGFVLRVLGNGGEQLFNCFQKIKDFLWSRKDGSVSGNKEKSCTV